MNKSKKNPKESINYRKAEPKAVAFCSAVSTFPAPFHRAAVFLLFLLQVSLMQPILSYVLLKFLSQLFLKYARWA